MHKNWIKLFLEICSRTDTHTADRHACLPLKIDDSDVELNAGAVQARSDLIVNSRYKMEVDGSE